MKEKSYQSWSLVIMAYNEEQTIEKVSLKAVDFLSPLPEDKKEILIIDDGSFDGTFKKAKHLADTFSFIRVYRNEKNFGIGAVLVKGYRMSRMENICAVPADNQFDLNELRAFRNIPDNTLVSFYRTGYEGYGLFRRLLTGANRWVNKILFGVKLQDVNYVTIYKRDFLKKLVGDSSKSLKQDLKESLLVSESSYIESEIMYYLTKQNLKIIQTPARHLAREYGVSTSVRAQTLKMVLKDIFKLLKVRLSLKKPKRIE